MKKTEQQHTGVDKLETRLKHQFKDPALLRQALTHCSASKLNNERLEFLGDSVLSLIISAYLFHTYPDASEGELSRIRATLVQQSTLAELARQLRLGEHLVLGTGEKKTGGANRDSILADAFEALLSALYMDAGMALCSDRIVEWFSPLIGRLHNGDSAKDAKTTLQELMQAKKLPLPVYEIIDIKGMDHQQEFIVHCTVSLLSDPVQGVGFNRKEAEQQAATTILEQLGGIDHD